MRVLIIGLGSIAQKHIKALKSVDEKVELFALRSSSSEREYSYPEITSIYNIDELSVVPDFIIITNPTFLHRQTIEDCLLLKSPIIIEKPVLGNPDEGNELSKKIEEAGVITYVACNMRFHPALQFVKQNLKPNVHKIQEVNIYCGSYLPDWRPNRNFREVYSAKKEMGGGVHLDLIHEIDYCVWLFGRPTKYSSIKSSKSHLKISAIDYVHYNFEYQNFNADITLNYYRRKPKRTLEILFEYETWLVDLLESTIINDNGEILFKSDFNIMDTYLDQAKYFCRHIKLNKTMMNDFNEALQILEIATR